MEYYVLQSNEMKRWMCLQSWGGPSFVDNRTLCFSQGLTYLIHCEGYIGQRYILCENLLKWAIYLLREALP